MTPSSPVFWVPDRDFAGVVATAHSNVGNDGITFGENTTWGPSTCRNHVYAIADFESRMCFGDPPSSPIRLAIDGTGSGALGGTQPNGALNPPYAKGHLDGIDWARDVTLQGVRAKDNTTAVWTTPDAYAGDVHDPVSQEPFMWNRNNPYEYSDPSGYAPVLVDGFGSIGGVNGSEAAAAEEVSEIARAQRSET